MNKDDKIVEVNEINVETVKKAEKEKQEKAKKEKDEKSKQRIEKIKNMFKKNNSDKLIMFLVYAFFIVATITVQAKILSITAFDKRIPIILTKRSMEEEKTVKLNDVDSLDINLESYDLTIKKIGDDKKNKNLSKSNLNQNIFGYSYDNSKSGIENPERATSSDEIYLKIKYNKKYDKKIKIYKRKNRLEISEKKKIFKLFKFNNKSNDIILEIPEDYAGDINIKNEKGKIKMVK